MRVRDVIDATMHCRNGENYKNVVGSGTRVRAKDRMSSPKTDQSDRLARAVLSYRVDLIQKGLNLLLLLLSLRRY